MNSLADIYATTTYVLLLKAPNNKKLEILKSTFKHFESTFDTDHPGVRACLDTLRTEITNITQKHTLTNLALTALTSSAINSEPTSLPTTTKTVPAKYMGTACSN